MNTKLHQIFKEYDVRNIKSKKLELLLTTANMVNKILRIRIMKCVLECSDYIIYLIMIMK